MSALMDREHSKQHAHELIDLIPPDQMIAVLRFLEFLLIEPALRKPSAIPEEDE